MAQPPV